MSNRYFGGIISATQPTTTSGTSGTATGSWTSTQALQKTASSTWPTAKTAPGAPTIGTASAGNAQASVTFSAPASDGGSTITSYTATSSPGGFTGTNATSPVIVTGLTNGTAYTFTVTATNAVATGPASAASNSVTPLAVIYPSTIELLAVAGGGGGAYSLNGAAVSGAGGAGGYISNGSFAVSSGTFTGTYTVTVGAGGSVAQYVGGRGTNSVFSGTNVTTQTAYGGGGGGTPSGGPDPNSDGGSGGGGGANVGYNNAGRGVYPGSPYISAARQGYDGGGGGGLYGHGGGGGGAGGAGGAGPGGPGVANSISGASVTYARGGTWSSTAAGTANSGNGGNTEGGTTAVAGDSGVVILKYPDSYSPASATTGSPTITVAGGYRIYKFTSSGSITFS